MKTVHKSFVIKFSTFTAFCNIDIWFGLTGLNLLFGTLFMRLLRVYHVFRVFRKTSRLWSDQFLFLGVMIICSGEVFILLLWTAIDIFHLEASEVYVRNAQPPYYSASATCSSTNLGIWLAVALSYTGLLILSVMFLAIQTRHIKLQHFKDTKKVNIFIFITVTVLAIALPVQYVFDHTQLSSLIGGHIAMTIAYLSVGLLCQLLMFASKTLPIFCKEKKTIRMESRFYL